MKHLLLFLIVPLLSCKTDNEPINTTKYDPEISKIPVKKIPDTLLFIDFFERFVSEDEFQKERTSKDKRFSFTSEKDFIAYLNSDTLSVFEHKSILQKEDLYFVNFKQKNATKYSFDKENGRWMYLGYETVLFNKIPDKDFINFFINFCEDGEYQKKHIKFPILYVYLNDDFEAQTDKIDFETWEYENFEEEIGGFFVLSTIQQNNLYRNIYYRGSDNGILIKLTFEKIKNEWFLTKTEDYST